MALRLQETEPSIDYEFVITPTGNELPDMIGHWKRVEGLLGKPLQAVSNGVSLLSEARRQQCLPNHRMRWCTRLLKIEPFQVHLLGAAPCTSYVGIRADEVADRDGVDHETIGEGITNRYPLVEWGWGVADVHGYLREKEVTIPRRTDCGLCFFQRMVEWWTLWKEHPDLYEEGVQLERDIGFTFRSEKKDSWPASLADLREAFKGGRTPRHAGQLKMFTSDNRSAMCAWCAR